MDGERYVVGWIGYFAACADLQPWTITEAGDLKLHAPNPSMSQAYTSIYTISAMFNYFKNCFSLVYRDVIGYKTISV